MAVFLYIDIIRSIIIFIIIIIIIVVVVIIVIITYHKSIFYLSFKQQ